MKLNFLYKHFFLLMAILFIAGLVLFSLGYIALNYMDAYSATWVDPIRDFLQAVGVWNWWFAILGLLFLMTGGYYTFDFIFSKSRFNLLVDSGSRAKFVKNREEIEELAWKLGEKYKQRTAEAIQNYKLK